MKKALITAIFTAVVASSAAQDSQTAYNFLRLPVSTHAAALGGDNVTIVEDDPSLMFANPALLSSVSDKTIGLNGMFYMAGAKTASASFNRNVGKRASWAASGQFVDYGTIKQTDASGSQLGDFNAREIALAGYFSYMLNDRFAGGITAKFITSHVAGYNSMAMGVDLGINYFDPDREWSLSIVAKNLGGQLKAYDDEYDPMPIDVQLGASKRLAHTPLRLSATLVDLTHWNYRFFNHLVLGLDASIGQSFWVGIGYNFRRAHEMNINTAEGGGTHMAGLSLGAGASLSRFKVGVAYAKYHVSSSSIVFNLAYSL